MKTATDLLTIAVDILTGREMRVENIAVGEVVNKLAAAMAVVKVALSMPGIIPAELHQASEGSVAFS